MSSNSRDRVLDVAWELAQSEGIERVTMATIARASGISRQMVYLHFGSRAGLLTEMARRSDRRSGFIAAILETRSLAPREALEALIRAWCAYIPEIEPVARQLQAAQLNGADGGQAWEDRMQAFREELRLAVARCPLRAGWSVAEATDWIYARAHFTAWTHLVRERGWEPAKFADRTLADIAATALAPVTRDQ